MRSAPRLTCTTTWTTTQRMPDDVYFSSLGTLSSRVLIDVLTHSAAVHSVLMTARRHHHICFKDGAHGLKTHRHPSSSLKFWGHATDARAHQVVWEVVGGCQVRRDQHLNLFVGLCCRSPVRRCAWASAQLYPCVVVLKPAGHTRTGTHTQVPQGKCIEGKITTMMMREPHYCGYRVVITRHQDKKKWPGETKMKLMSTKWS